jgi:hypothetical protein
LLLLGNQITLLLYVLLQGVCESRYLQIRPARPQQQQQQQQQRVERSWRRSNGAAAAADAKQSKTVGQDTVARVPAATAVELDADGSSAHTRPRLRQQQQQQGGQTYNSGSSSRRPDVRRGHPGWAKQVWLWCQQEGAALERYSQGEIKQLLGAGEEKLPQEVAQLIAKRWVLSNSPWLALVM